MEKIKKAVDYLNDEEAPVVESQFDLTDERIEQIKQMLDQKSQNVQIERIEEVLKKEDPKLMEAVDATLKEYQKQDRSFRAEIVEGLKEFFDQTSKAFAETAELDLSVMDSDRLEAILSGLFLFRVECDELTRMDAYKEAFTRYSDSLGQFFNYVETVDEALLEFSAQRFIDSLE